jgi:uncharacterized Zn finger protein
MSLLLTNFKQVIPQNILTRGRDYYRGGRVVDLNLEDEGLWSAQVAGTDTYDVQIEQRSDGTLICSCTCPYEYGEHCKHMAAVLYAIEDTYPEYLGGKKPRKQGKKRETRADKLQKALDAASDTQLRTFVLDLAREDRSVYNRLLLQFGGPDTTRDSYDRMVKDALRAGRGEYGMIDYWGASAAAKGVRKLLQRADELLAQSRPDAALAVYQAVAGNVVEALQSAHDSNGYLGECISSALEGIEKCAAGLATPAKRALFTYCLAEARSARFSGWDWRWDWLDIAANIVEMPEERATLFETLDEIDEIDGPSKASREGRGDFMAEYRREQTAQIRLNVVQRLDGDAAADAFIQAHLDLRRFKELVIERHIERGEFDQAKTLIMSAGQEAKKKRLPGLDADYRDYLLTIAEREGDTQTVIRLAREGFVQRGDEDYYQTLKKAVPAEQWSSFVESLLRDARRSDFAQEMSAWIFAREGLWDRLLGVVKESVPSLAEYYRADLEKRFPNEMAALYETFCLKLLARSGDRRHYQRACDYLRRMKQLGQTIRAETVKDMLRSQYPSRRALLDELNKV